jgi:hypothetical protein
MSMSLSKRSSVPPVVVTWRTDRLVAAGLSATLARPIAANCGYDIHALLSLIDRGCPAELAARIIAPLEATGRS